MNTQLIIAGIEAVLPQTFSVTVKRENPFFTKSGEYTYDCTLRLDNTVNQQLYGFLHRLNNTRQVDTKRSAVLIADGHVYCRGTEVITRWTEETVSVQVVSGNSELNYFIGSSLRLDWLDLGSVDLKGYREADTPHDLRWNDGAEPVYRTEEYCLPYFRDKNGNSKNYWGNGTEYEEGQEPYTHPYDPDLDEPGGNYHTFIYCKNAAPQPYLIDFLHHLIEALGYTVVSDQLSQTIFRHLFLVNTVMTTERAKMFAGWTVIDFLEEVEKLCGVVFLIDNIERTCQILQKTVFYQNARQLPLRNVIDAYTTDVLSDDEQQADFMSSTVSYELPDHHLANLMKLPEELIDTTTTLQYESLQSLRQAAMEVSPNDNVLLRDQSTGRLYIVAAYRQEWAAGPYERRYLLEVNQFATLKRDDAPQLDVAFTPAPIEHTYSGEDLIVLTENTTASSATDSGDTAQEPASFAEAISTYSKEDTQKEDIYVAFCNGSLYKHGNLYSYPVAYTDAYHAMASRNAHLGDSLNGQPYDLIPANGDPFAGPSPEGSLRFQDLDTDYYQGGYQIDTAHAVTFETFDPNVIDVRHVYVIQNRRYVVRDAEETITAEGRSPKWKLTCYPIIITDEAIEKRWILTKGAWDDGGAWLDDGRWIDEPISQ